MMIYVGLDETPEDVAKALLELAGDNPRVVRWVPEEQGFDVPEDMAETYTTPKARPRKTTAAKKTTLPAPAEE